MKALLKIFLIALLWVPAKAGQEGNGGDGVAILWRQIAKEMHKEAVMEEYKEEMQLRDQINLEEMIKAILFTDVVTTDEKVVDNMGHPRTAIFLTPDQLKERWSEEGISEGEIERRLKIASNGAIIVQRGRFLQEYSASKVASFQLIWHDYMRAMGINDDQYNYSDPIFEKSYFSRLIGNASETTNQVVQHFEDGISGEDDDLDDELSDWERRFEIADRRVARVDKEQALTWAKIQESKEALDEIMNTRGEAVRERAIAIQEQFNAIGDTSETMGFMAMPFGASRGETIKTFGVQVSSGHLLHQKIKKMEVIDMQVDFLMRRMNADMDWELELSEIRKTILRESY